MGPFRFDCKCQHCITKIKNKDMKRDSWVLKMVDFSEHHLKKSIFLSNKQANN